MIPKQKFHQNLNVLETELSLIINIPPIKILLDFYNAETEILLNINHTKA